MSHDYLSRVVKAIGDGMVVEIRKHAAVVDVEPCPYCAGSGIDGHSLLHNDRPFHVRCANCGGTGQIATERREA